MPNRREFLRTAAGATAGLVVGGGTFVQGGLRSLQVGAPAGKRREVFLAGDGSGRWMFTLTASCQRSGIW